MQLISQATLPFATYAAPLFGDGRTFSSSHLPTDAVLSPAAIALMPRGSWCDVGLPGHSVLGRRSIVRTSTPGEKDHLLQFRVQRSAEKKVLLAVLSSLMAAEIYPHFPKKIAHVPEQVKADAERLLSEAMAVYPDYPEPFMHYPRLTLKRKGDETFLSLRFAFHHPYQVGGVAHHYFAQGAGDLFNLHFDYEVEAAVADHDPAQCSLQFLAHANMLAVVATATASEAAQARWERWWNGEVRTELQVTPAVLQRIWGARLLFNVNGDDFVPETSLVLGNKGELLETLHRVFLPLKTSGAMHDVNAVFDFGDAHVSGGLSYTPRVAGAE